MVQRIQTLSSRDTDVPRTRSRTPALLHCLISDQPRNAGAPAGDDVTPPSTKISAPCTFDESSDARNSTVLATSSGLPKRPSGMVCEILASSATLASGVGAVRSQIGVVVPPGETTLTRILRGDSSDAITRAIARTPALL